MAPPEIIIRSRILNPLLRFRTEVIALTVTLAACGALLAYGRDHELDADNVGLVILIRAGYDPAPLIGFFEKLDRSASPPEFLSTHPEPGNRVRRLRQVLAGRSNLPTYRGDPEAFAAIRAKL